MDSSAISSRGIRVLQSGDWTKTSNAWQDPRYRSGCRARHSRPDRARLVPSAQDDCRRRDQQLHVHVSPQRRKRLEEQIESLLWLDASDGADHEISGLEPQAARAAASAPDVRRRTVDAVEHGRHG